MASRPVLVDPAVPPAKAVGSGASLDAWRAVVEALPHLLALAGADGAVEWLSPQWLAYTGASSDAHLGDGWVTALHPEDRERVRTTCARAVRAGEPVQLEYRLRRADGVHRCFHAHLVPLRDGSGRIARWLASSSDVEEARQAERSLRASAELERAAHAAAEKSRVRSELLASVISDLSATVDLPRVLVTGLDRAVRLLGGAEGALFLLEPDGRHVRGLAEVWAKDRTGAVLALDQTPHTREALERFEPVFFTREEAVGHEPAWMDRIDVGAGLVCPMVIGRRCVGFLYVNYRPGAAAPSRADRDFAKALAGQCALAVSRAQAFEAERAARAEAEGIARLQDQLMGVVGHDLRTPLQSIVLGTALLLQRGDTSEASRTTLRRVASSAGRMRQIIRDLLDLARVRRAGTIPVQRRTTRIEAVCARAVHELQQAHPRRAIEVALSGTGEGEWDPDRLEQVLSNLVGNALQRGPEDRPVRVRAEGGPDALVLTVQNDGPAIAPELLERIFEPFRRGDDKGTAGLGLFIVREIVRAHGGTVEARSTDAEGTSFTVRLPRR